uniref:NADH-ubiquinone oxidoreductase chain 2 n=1 Tax=Ligia oceanica TaxID=96856 RepID=Q09TF1_LIGOC|nr:NADH dehydrogenase subunit 2 [Ligia oceanica]
MSNALFQVFKNFTFLLFSFTLMTGVYIAISSNSWFGVWLGLELNLMSFIPIILVGSMNSVEVEAGLKYFLVQACGSLVLLQSSLYMSSVSVLSTILVMMALSLKMGAAPFHFWFPMVLEGLDWGKVYLLSSLQKVAPLCLTYYWVLISSGWGLMVVVVFSGVVGALGGVNELSLRKLLGYSSINHLGWLPLAMIQPGKVWMEYFSIYILMLLVVVWLFKINDMHWMGQLVNLNMNIWTRVSIMMSMMSLGGLPPLLGFLPKWLVIQTLTGSFSSVLVLILLSTNVVTLFFYLRLSLASLAGMLRYNEFKSKSISSSEVSSVLVNLSGLGLAGPVLFSLSQ